MTTQTTFQKRWLPLIGMLLIVLVTVLGLGALATVIATLIVFLITWLEKPEGYFASLGFKKVNLRAIPLLLKAPLVAMALILLSGFVLPPLVVAITGQSWDLSAFEVLKDNTVQLAVTLPIVWILAAFGEEIVFRGFLMTRFTKVFGEGRISLIANVLVFGLIFGFAHGYQGITGQVLTGLTGMMLAVIFHRNKNNIWFNIAVHGWTDTIIMILFYFYGPDFLL